ncbi:Ribokinase-like protein [Schizopora paradoxa]|uniref:Ribokinase-like protein n=1 Tax=Schizopora paradoxa TaxID=27342 RepID=A0A0H2RUZ0_9AGAM|nr:Ribokinase-like protein [Schizopora paradoxa]
MIIDRGHDFPTDIQSALQHYGSDMWLFRDNPDAVTTRAVNIYQGDHRGFQYLTPRRRITPNDLTGTKFDRPSNVHFICSPTRAQSIVNEIQSVPEWHPVTIFEPIPDRCVPAELPSLLEVLPHIDILSPNAEEALSLLSISDLPSKEVIEEACMRFLNYGVGPNGRGHVIIRSGELGALVACREKPAKWIDAFWTNEDASKVVDVTGAGNSFLGGLSAGLYYTNDVYEATFFASVSASFTIEQLSLPKLTSKATSVDQEQWNGDVPSARLKQLKARCHWHASY